MSVTYDADAVAGGASERRCVPGCDLRAASSEREDLNCLPCLALGHIILYAHHAPCNMHARLETFAEGSAPCTPHRRRSWRSATERDSLLRKRRRRRHRRAAMLLADKLDLQNKLKVNMLAVRWRAPSNPSAPPRARAID